MTYGPLATIYDLLLRGVDYEAWADYIEELLLTHGHRPRRILDLACGTGNSSIPLARRGYRVTGVDISAQMLEVASQKSAAAGVQVDFLCQDIRKLDLPGKFDLVVIFQDGLNYLLTGEELRDALQGMWNVLVPGGMAIFDLNMLNHLPVQGAKEVNRLEEGGFALTWESEYRPAEGLWEIELYVESLNKEGVNTAFREVHREKFHRPDEVKVILQTLGFSVKGIYRAFSLNPPDEQSPRVFFAVHKPSAGSPEREGYNEYCPG